MSLSATTLMGVVGATVMFVGARQILAHTLTLGDFMTFTAFLAFLVAPMFQVVGIGTQITEALAGLDRTQEVLHEKPGGRRSASARGTVGSDATARSLSKTSPSPTTPASPCCHDVSFEAAARHRHRPGGPVRLRQIHHHQPDRRLP